MQEAERSFPVVEAAAEVVAGARRKNYRLRRRLVHGVAYLFAFALALTALYPFFVMLIGATHDSYAITTQLNLLPGDQLARNYARLTQTMDIWRGFANSAWLSTISTFATLYLSALTAYGFSKFSFRGKGLLFGVVLVAMMLPGQLGIIGFYKLVDKLALLDSYLPLVANSAVNCFAVFLFKQYLDGCLPNELIEAALVDGSGEIRIFHTMALGLMRPVLVTQGIMSFIGSWNSYMTPLILLYSRSKMTLPLMVATVRDAMATDYGAQFVGMLISVVPLVIIFCLGSRVIMEEIAIGAAIKG